MKPLRVLAAAIAAGVALFVWGFVSHTLLPIGEMGLKSLPGEAAVLPAMSSVIREHGFYMFPGIPPGKPTDADMKAWEEKYKAGPRGIIVYDPTGDAAMSPAMLGSELASNLAAAFIATLLLARLNCSVVGRALAGAGLGLFAWLSIEVSHVIWWRFPWEYATGSLIDQAVGGLLAGLVIGLVLGRRAPAPA